MFIEKIFFETKDGIRIAANWNGSGKDHFTAILLHMMPATKESWVGLEHKLNEAGISSLAIDFRGHGESTIGARGRLDYKLFSDSEHQAKINDIMAAVSWLGKKDVFLENLVLIGASIGANLAIQFLAEHPEVPSAVALSPGLDYRGIVTMPLVKALQRNQNLFLAASDDDPESYNAVQKLNEISLAKTKLRLLHHSGHGTTMFDKNSEFMEELVQWVKEHSS